MIRKYDDIIGMPVLSIQEGKELGKIVQIAVKPEDGKVIGFLVENEKTGTAVLPVEHTVEYGNDMVMASSATKLRSLGDLAKSEGLTDYEGNVIGLKIITEEGAYIGNVGTFYFDDVNGIITHYTTSEGPYSDFMEGKGLLPAPGVTAVSSDALVVTKDSAELADVLKTKPGLKQKTGAIKGKAEKGIQKAIDKAEEFIKA